LPAFAPCRPRAHPTRGSDPRRRARRWSRRSRLAAPSIGYARPRNGGSQAHEQWRQHRASASTKPDRGWRPIGGTKTVSTTATRRKKSRGTLPDQTQRLTLLQLRWPCGRNCALGRWSGKARVQLRQTSPMIAPGLKSGAPISASLARSQRPRRVRGLLLLASAGRRGLASWKGRRRLHCPRVCGHRRRSTGGRERCRALIAVAKKRD
jgi:hypothetical protein